MRGREEAGRGGVRGRRERILTDTAVKHGLAALVLGEVVGSLRQLAVKVPVSLVR